MLLLAVTLLFWGWYDRYEPDGPTLLQSPSMADATRLRGDCNQAGGHFTLTVVPGGQPASINFRLPNAAHYDRIRVQGRMKLHGVVEGRNPWRCARLLLVQYDANDKWIPGYHGVVAKSGTRDWQRYEDVFKLDPHAVYVDLVIQQTGNEGSADFDRLMAEPVRLRSSFRWWRLAFAMTWWSMAVLYFRRCRLHQRRLRVLILLNAVAIVFGTLMPGKWIEDTSHYAQAEAARIIENAGERATPAAPSPAPSPGRDFEQKKIEQFNKVVGGAHSLGHFMLFASLCFLIYLSAALEGQSRSYFFRVAFDVLLFAGVTESLQYLTLDRTPGVLDWLVDMYGMAFALACFLVLLLIVRFRSGRART
jgi:VanZ family protein